MSEYTIYGSLGDRTTVAWATTLRAKGVPVSRVPETPSLSLALESRSGRDRGPYLRTPEGFVLAGGHAVLEWIERTHPTPPLLPGTPVRRACARMLEDWIDLWLPFWPRRSWGTLDRLGAHLGRAGYLLGAEPIRADFLLAAWLETEVLVDEAVRDRIGRVAPRLLGLGSDLLEGAVASRGATGADDAIPISLLDVLEELTRDYHAYLIANQRAIKDDLDSVSLDLGLGPRPLPVQRACETRRVEIGRELALLPTERRRDVARVLDPLGAWAALRLPPVLDEVDPSDPRSL